MSLIDSLTEEILNRVESGEMRDADVARLIKEMQNGTRPPAERVRRVEPVRRVTDVVRTFTCAHCGARWTITHQIKETESFAAMSKTGPIIITFKGPHEVESWAASCSCCHFKVERMSREELEKAYLALLKHKPLPDSVKKLC